MDKNNLSTEMIAKLVNSSRKSTVKTYHSVLINNLLKECDKRKLTFKEVVDLLEKSYNEMAELLNV